MNIRRYVPSDATSIDEIYKRNHKNYNLPNLSHMIAGAVVEDENGKIIAFGCLELVPEATLVLDQNLPLATKVKALQNLVQDAKYTTRMIGFDFFLAIPDSTEYGKELEKHFNFTPYPTLRKVVT